MALVILVYMQLRPRCCYIVCAQSKDSPCVIYVGKLMKIYMHNKSNQPKLNLKYLKLHRRLIQNTNMNYPLPQPWSKIWRTHCPYLCGCLELSK